jgi:glycosyltransferase involved in cell wall biosynthesis
MNSHTKTVALAYLGLRGGGSRFLLDLAQLYSESGYKVVGIISESLETKDELQRYATTLYEFKVPHTIFQLIGTFLSRKEKKKELLKFLLEENLEDLIICMPQPTDCYFFSKASNTRLIRVFHDPTTRVGNLWPNYISNWRRLRQSDIVIALTKEGLRKLPKVGCKKRHLLPLFTYSAECEHFKSTKRVVMAGRGKAYQNTQLGIDGFNLSQYSETGELLVVGENSSKHKYSKNSKYIDRWLSDEELEQYICDSQALILPYKSVSQSGLAEIAFSHLTPVIATPLNGFREQISHMGNGLLCAGFKPKDVADAIDQIGEVQVDPHSDRFSERMKWVHFLELRKL